VDDQNPANDTPSDQYGNDIIAGGPDNDEIFGQLGEDIIQGDGQVLLSLPGAEPVDSDAWRDANGLLNIIPSQERISDGDDYIEGNGGSDVIFGNLGQDDIIGGNSDLFGLELQKIDGIPQTLSLVAQHITRIWNVIVWEMQLGPMGKVL
jgi:hypothetical protein